MQDVQPSALNNKNIAKLIEQLQEEVKKDGGILFIGVALDEESCGGVRFWPDDVGAHDTQLHERR